MAKAIAGAIGLAALAGLSTVAYFRPLGSVPLGDPVTLVFTKDAWVECVANSESQVVIVSVEANAFVVFELTPNLKLVMQNSAGTARCDSIGIKVAAAPEYFYVPFSTLHKVVKDRRVLWRTPLRFNL